MAAVAPFDAASCVAPLQRSAQSPPLKLRVGSAAAQLRQTVCTARVDGTTRAVWLREPAGRPDGSRRQTDFTASPACAPTYCCAAAQGAAMGSLPIARTLLSVLGTWSVVACERCGVEVNLPALGVPFVEVGHVSYA